MGISRKCYSGADEYMNSYFTSFRLFMHLGVNNICATGVLNKNRLQKCTIGDKQLQKRNVATLNSAHQAKKVEQRWQWLEQQQGGLHRFLLIFWA